MLRLSNHITLSSTTRPQVLSFCIMRFSFLISLLLSAGALVPSAAQRPKRCGPKPEPIRDIKFTDKDGEGIHDYELFEDARIVEPAPDGVARALRIDSVYSHARLNNLDVGPTALPEMTVSIGLYIESIRPPHPNTPSKDQQESFGWIFSHDNGGYDRAIFLHDERMNGVGITIGKKVAANTQYTIPPLKKWIQMLAIWRQGGECELYIDEARHNFASYMRGRNNEGLKYVALGAPSTRSYARENNNDFWIKDIKIFDYALSKTDIDNLKCHFDNVCHYT